MPAPPVGDLQRIQGTWVVTHNEVKRISLPHMNGTLFIFRNDGFRLGDDPPGYQRFAIDEGHDPRHIDFDINKPSFYRGIYILSGDDLTICTGGPGDPRPTEFSTARDSTRVLTKLKRR